MTLILSKRGGAEGSSKYKISINKYKAKALTGRHILLLHYILHSSANLYNFKNLFYKPLAIRNGTFKAFDTINLIENSKIFENVINFCFKSHELSRV